MSQKESRDRAVDWTKHSAEFRRDCSLAFEAFPVSVGGDWRFSVGVSASLTTRKSPNAETGLVIPDPPAELSLRPTRKQSPGDGEALETKRQDRSIMKERVFANPAQVAHILRAGNIGYFKDVRYNERRQTKDQGQRIEPDLSDWKDENNR
ncbi:MAG: hypothetical protein LQ352_007454 [Teloschistes flavicans]|nr:MAG: hypothetical protein LQ352_007454 [Teloschistes flavicans]